MHTRGACSPLLVPHCGLASPAWAPCVPSSATYRSTPRCDGALPRTAPPFSQLFLWCVVCGVCLPVCLPVCACAWTYQRGWDSTQLSDTFCEAAAGGTGQQANNILVFSHASGGLVVANALASNRCSFASNVQWYTAATPFHGAKGADRALADVCPSYSAVREFLDSMFYCKGRDHDQLHDGMATLQTAYVTSNDVSYVADSYLSGALCGHSAEGLNEGLAQALPDVAATMAWGGHENDGIIDVEVCKLIHSGFVKYDLSAQWADMHMYVHASASGWSVCPCCAWRLTELAACCGVYSNHVDTSCRYGDANYDPYFDHSPCTWMQAMAARM